MYDIIPKNGNIFTCEHSHLNLLVDVTSPDLVLVCGFGVNSRVMSFTLVTHVVQYVQGIFVNPLQLVQGNFWHINDKADYTDPLQDVSYCLLCHLYIPLLQEKGELTNINCTLIAGMY